MQRASALLALSTLVALCIGCGAVATADGNANADAGDAPSGPTGTKPPDGAPGVCCPASIGGCAKMGGYHADGKCPVNDEICDNMCEQRIVKDEHGCNVLTYKNPPVTTVYAGPQSCDSPVFNGGGTTPTPTPKPATTACAYEDVDNDARCPSTFSQSYRSQPCPAIGLQCAFPGQGDGQSDGCFATAMMWCVGDAGQHDGGPDAGPGTWTLAQ